MKFSRRQKKALRRILIAAALFLVLLLVRRLWPEVWWAHLIAAIPPYLIIGWPVLRKAWMGVLNRQPFDENLLMAVASLGAMALREFPESVAVLLFYEIGELFEDVAVGRSRKSIADLMDIRPDYANLEIGDLLQQVEPETVEIGSVIVVKPGERVPLDGTVLDGASSLNLAALTGESVPVDVKTGDPVLSGSVNLTGVLRLRVEKVYGDSTVARILELVENSSLKKAKTEHFITRFARWYTPLVVLAAVVLAVLPPVLNMLHHNPAQWGEWIPRALTFLVISCPCAMVLSIPLTFFAGIGGASGRGILIKGSSYLELLAKTDRVVFDKTGTLTRGVFEVVEVHPEPEISAGELLRIAAAAERFSDHPVSQSIQTAAGPISAQDAASDAAERPGEGVVAIVGGQRVAVGNQRLMQALGLQPKGVFGAGTLVHVAREGRYLGCIEIADRPKPGAAAAVQDLRESGVQRIVMLTGDRKAAADAAAKELGVTEVLSELLPGDKVEKVEALLAEGGKGKTLAFVGDGINDAPVLARADVGVAMGAIGSDAAIEAADVVLMDDDPGKLALTMRIARKTMAIVRQNIVFALGVKAICLILGALGVAGMWLAIFADVGVLILCVLNATRAMSVKKL